MSKAITMNGRLTKAVDEVMSKFKYDRLYVAPLNDGGAEIEISFPVIKFENGTEGYFDILIEIYENNIDAFNEAIFDELKNHNYDCYIKNKKGIDEDNKEYEKNFKILKDKSQTLLEHILNDLNNEFKTFNNDLNKVSYFRFVSMSELLK